MAGMMPTDDPAQAAPADAGMPQGGPPQAANDNSASPEEQAQYNQFVGRAMELINSMMPDDNPRSGPLVEMLRGGSDAGDEGPGDQPDQGAPNEGTPAEEQAPPPGAGQPQPAGPPDHGANGPAKGLAQTTVMILAKVGSAAEAAGQTLSPDVVFHGGSEIFSQLAEISDKAGISDYANDRDALEAAYYLTIDMATEQMAQSGEIDKEGAKAAMQQLVEMDAKGELEQIFQSLDAKDQGGKPAGKPGEQPQSGGMMPKGA